MTRVRLESRWQSAGAQVLKKAGAGSPDLIVLDLSAREGSGAIPGLREQYPMAQIIAYGPHVDGEAFKFAREAGADECVARGSVVERVLSKLEKRD